MLRRLLLGIAFAIGLLAGSVSTSALTPDQRAILLVQPQPTLNLDFRGCSAIDSRISFTRAANTATFWGSNLLLQTANANIPRLDYNYATGACNGLEIEQASTNVAIQNRDMTNAAWVKVTTTAALDQVGIDGSANSASSLLAAAGNATTLQTVVHVSSTDTYSVYLKRLTGTGEIDLSLDGVTWTAANSSICTLGNGSGATASAILTTAWVRCTITQATVVNPAFGIRIVTNADKVAVDYSQVEVNGFATSAIATTTVAVTRNADVATMATSGFGYNSTQGTIFNQWINKTVGASGDFGVVSSIDDGSNNNSMRIISPNGLNQVQFAVLSSSVSQAALSFSSVLTIGAVQKGAAVYKANDFAFSFGGASPQISASGSVPIVNQLSLGKQPSGTQLNGWLQQVKYWPQRLPNPTLIQMTRPGQQSWLEPANDNAPFKLAVNQ